jgi:hypothetical protein
MACFNERKSSTASSHPAVVNRLVIIKDSRDISSEIKGVSLLRHDLLEICAIKPVGTPRINKEGTDSASELLPELIQELDVENACCFPKGFLTRT